MTDNAHLRRLPSVDRLLREPAAEALSDVYGREAVREALRERLDLLRAAIRHKESPDISPEALIQQIDQSLQSRFQPTLRPVINATGVIIHTNLGRAPLSQAAQLAIQQVASQYNNLEFDLDTGQRGSRYTHAEALLCELSGAEAALVVNNTAAALVLLLAALAAGREVILSRGQLVEIGGGFRVPDIMRQGGVRLVEVGTTNRTRIADYAEAIGEQTAFLMRVHSSNFRQIGFVEEVPLAEMAALAHAHDLLLVDDLGSGAFLDTAAYGLAHEPTFTESLAAGADLVAFSGDKLLGGPQCGILLGRADIISRLKRHPLARALRADKLCYAGLSATLDHYRRGEATQQIPIWQMIARPLADIQATARYWADALGAAVITGESTVGGGSLPGTNMPTALLALKPAAPDNFLAQLRQAATPIIGRIVADQVVFDPRTVLPGQEPILLDTLRRMLDATR